MTIDISTQYVDMHSPIAVDGIRRRVTGRATVQSGDAPRARTAREKSERAVGPHLVRRANKVWEEGRECQSEQSIPRQQAMAGRAEWLTVRVGASGDALRLRSHGAARCLPRGETLADYLASAVTRLWLIVVAIPISNPGERQGASRTLALPRCASSDASGGPGRGTPRPQRFCDAQFRLALTGFVLPRDTARHAGRSPAAESER